MPGTVLGDEGSSSEQDGQNSLASRSAHPSRDRQTDNKHRNIS